MLLPIRAGRSSRPCSSFVRLAKHRAHGRQNPVRYRCFATDTAGPGEEGSAASKALSSRLRLYGNGTKAENAYKP